jgi:hypothetical protein
MQSTVWLVLSVLVTSCAGRQPPTADAGVTTTDAGSSLPDAGSGPQLVVEPGACVFGSVGVGGTVLCDLALRNVGDRDMSITNMGFDDATDATVFGAVGIFSLPTLVPAGSAIDVHLRATPTEARTYAGSLGVSIEGHSTLDATVPLSVTGTAAPLACARVRSINGVENTLADPPVKPLDDVILTGDCSTPSRVGGAITSYRWTTSQADKPP